MLQQSAHDCSPIKKEKTPMTRQTKSYLGFSISLSVVVCLAVSATMFMRLAKTASPQQQKEQLLHRLPVEKGEPIVITDIRVDGRKIAFDENFSTDDDWLQHLAVTVKNRSDKAILVVQLQLQVPPRAGSDGRIIVTPMFYGNADLLVRRPTAAERRVGLIPGESAVVTLTEDQFRALRDFLSSKGYPASVGQVNFRIGSILFEDDTTWYGGEIMRRDPQKPGKWVVHKSLAI